MKMLFRLHLALILGLLFSLVEPAGAQTGPIRLLQEIQTDFAASEGEFLAGSGVGQGTPAGDILSGFSSSGHADDGFEGRVPQPLAGPLGWRE